MMSLLCQIQYNHYMRLLSENRLKINLPKNRYTDVLCFDHSRVVLPLAPSGTEVPALSDASDYINANFVDGYMQKNAYISTQGNLF